MTATYRDYDWIIEQYPWIEVSVGVVLANNVGVDEMLDALTHEGIGSAFGLATPPNERPLDGEPAFWIAPITEDWTLAIGEAWMKPGVADTLSQGGTLVHFHSTVNADWTFETWTVGSRTACFDPLLRRGFGLAPVPAEWQQRMADAGLNPDPDQNRMDDGRFHIESGAFALMENYTGVRITPEFLRDTEFQVGLFEY